ncbi:MAG: hypothetical protein Q9177_001617 [Variospora cf. flavescens]
MTDLSLPTNNHGPAVGDSHIGNGFSPTKPQPPSTTVTSGPGEDEDYTIKCICGFHDDDGNTVLCEHCETWQHTECYYFEGGEVLDVSEIEHYCADCKPRRLDARGAIQRQTMRREHSDLGDRKIKKATTKSHKKKVRPSDPHIALVNGTSSYERAESHGHPDRSTESPREYFPSTKRPKINHKYSGSLQSPNLLFGGSDRRSASAPRTAQSPSKTSSKYPFSDCSGELYSNEFMRLYDDDPGDITMQANLFNDIRITSDLSSWTQDAHALAEASNGLSPQDIFHRCDQLLDSMGFPFLHKECKRGDSFDADGRYPQWKFLTTDAPVLKGSIIGELKGKIGHMDDYCDDPRNRWDYLRHPLPFVFFHPRLPIYIDTRREGTKCRYLRRSCRPNLNMTTILENGSDYRFCFVAKDDLEAGSELTIGWTLDEHIREIIQRRHNEQFSNQGTNDKDDDYVSDWVGKVLADFGECACNSPTVCALARYDRRSSLSYTGAVKVPNGSGSKGRNGYSKRHSPYVDQVPHGMSRPGNPEEEDDDERSTSGSIRSKQPSQETTPTRTHVSGNTFATGVELSDREKRKIAALEKNFEQIEQDKNQPAHKKKKRNSGGSTFQASVNSGTRQQVPVSTFSQPNTPGIMARPHAIDQNASRRTSGSPVGKQAFLPNNSNGKAGGRKKRSTQVQPPSSPPPTARPNYVSTSMQTEPNQHADWYDVAEREQSRKPFISLSKQLLLRSQRERIKLEQQLQGRRNGVTPKQPNGDRTVPLQIKEDADMQDVQPSNDCTGDDTTNNSPVQKPRPPDIEDNQADDSLKTSIYAPSVPTFGKGDRPTSLQVQLPSQPSLVLGESSSASPKDVSQSPIVARPPPLFAPPVASITYPPLHQSSLNTTGMPQPSPVKKKYSLGEYMSRLQHKTEPPASMVVQAAQSSPVFTQDPVKASIGLDHQSSIKDGGGAIVDTPRQETGDPMEEG